jgi:biopolymer transport protein ExbD
MGKTDVPVIVDADERVPWNQVVNVLNLSKEIGIGKFEFARGAATYPK